DRHASTWRNAFHVTGADGLDLDDAYKAMAWLGEVDASGRSTAEAVEEALYRHRQPLLGEITLAFFDTTSLWFEGAGGESLGQRGHTKDYRGHLKQVVLGIVLDGEDRPIASFLLPGNTADVTVLLPVVRRLRERFGIARRDRRRAPTQAGAGRQGADLQQGLPPLRQGRRRRPLHHRSGLPRARDDAAAHLPGVAAGHLKLASPRGA